jgi:amidase
LPFREVQLPPKLKFGYYTSGKWISLYQEPRTNLVLDGFIKASPACKRAVLETIEALRRNGHECVEITLPDSESLQLLYELGYRDALPFFNSCNSL